MERGLGVRKAELEAEESGLGRMDVGGLGGRRGIRINQGLGFLNKRVEIEHD